MSHSVQGLMGASSAALDATVTKAESLGGSVMMPADDFPSAGRLAWLRDPMGASFAIIKPLPPQS
ncbi:MAG: hypothetical protein ABR529_10505 [Actinomycetota bacterium]